MNKSGKASQQPRPRSLPNLRPEAALRCSLRQAQNLFRATRLRTLFLVTAALIVLGSWHHALQAEVVRLLIEPVDSFLLSAPQSFDGLFFIGAEEQSDESFRAPVAGALIVDVSETSIRILSDTRLALGNGTVGTPGRFTGPTDSREFNPTAEPANYAFDYVAPFPFSAVVRNLEIQLSSNSAVPIIDGHFEPAGTSATFTAGTADLTLGLPPIVDLTTYPTTELSESEPAKITMNDDRVEVFLPIKFTIRVVGPVTTETTYSGQIHARSFRSNAPWPNIKLDTVVSAGLEQATSINHAGDQSNRLFVTQKPGTIRIIEQSHLLQTPFLDLRERVIAGRLEEGLLSLAFAPDYLTSGRFYTSYTRPSVSGRELLLSRFRVSDSPNQADPSSEEILLAIPMPQGIQIGGHLVFGGDGMLWFGVGDGGTTTGTPSTRAQDLTDLRGKILRLDVSEPTSYTVPRDNPYANRDQQAKEIWSAGWRNPWAFDFDPDTHHWFLADVGASKLGEVNVEPHGFPGRNYGWPRFEPDSLLRPDLELAVSPQEPVATFSHQETLSIIGGKVYRGSQFPTMEGIYFYSGFPGDCFWGLRHESTGWTQQKLASATRSISCYGSDEAGDLFVADYKLGSLHRIIDSHSPPPVPLKIQIDPNSGTIEIRSYGPSGSYQLEKSEDLSKWESTGNPQVSTDSATRFSDFFEKEKAALFFRVIKVQE